MGNSASIQATPATDAAALVALARLHPELHTILKSNSPASTITDMYKQLYADKPKQETIRGAIRAAAISRNDYALFEQFAEPLIDPYVGDSTISAHFRTQRLAKLKHDHVMTILRAATTPEAFMPALIAYARIPTPEEHQELARAATDAVYAAAYPRDCTLFAEDTAKSVEISAAITAERIAAAALPEPVKLAAEATIAVADAAIEAAAVVAEAASDAAAVATEIATDAGEAKAFAEEVLQS